MSFIKTALAAAVAAVALGGLAGCAETQPSIASDFGIAVRQDLAAQIADPEAHYGKTDSDGARAALAQERYRADRVIPPSAIGTSKAGSSSGAGPSQ